MVAKQPRGIRSNNPGNIDHNPRNKWLGLADPPIEQGVANPRFARFVAPEYGIRAIAMLLMAYQDKHGLNTVSGLIGRWAPSSENDTGSYALHVADALGVRPRDPINVHDHATMAALVRAIIQHENGRQPYSEAQINHALRLAGIVPPEAVHATPRPLLATKTAQGAGITGVAGLVGAGAQIADQVDTGQHVVEAAKTASLLAQPGTWLAGTLALVIVLGVAWTLYGRWDARRRSGV